MTWSSDYDQKIPLTVGKIERFYARQIQRSKWRVLLAFRQRNFEGFFHTPMKIGVFGRTETQADAVWTLDRRATCSPCRHEAGRASVRKEHPSRHDERRTVANRSSRVTTRDAASGRHLARR